MKLIPDISFHEVAGETVVLLPIDGGERTRVLSFNSSSLYLLESVRNREFELDDIASLLEEKYEVDSKTARKDASSWLKTLKKQGLVL